MTGRQQPDNPSLPTKRQARESATTHPAEVPISGTPAALVQKEAQLPAQFPVLPLLPLLQCNEVLVVGGFQLTWILPPPIASQYGEGHYYLHTLQPGTVNAEGSKGS